MRGWVLRPGRRSYHNPLSIREGKGKGGQQGLEVGEVGVISAPDGRRISSLHDSSP